MLRPFPSSFAGLSTALTLAVAGCFSDGPPPSNGATGGSGNAPSSEGGQVTTGQGGDAATELPAGLRFYHALTAQPRVTISVDDESVQELELGSGSELLYFPAGRHVLRAWVDEVLLAEVELELAAAGSSSQAIVLIPTPAGPKLQLVALDDEAETPTLTLIGAARGGPFEIDVGANDAAHPELTLAAGEEGAAELDPTRPALRVAAEGRDAAAFTLERPGQKEHVIGVLLGDARATSDDANNALRVLAFRGQESKVVLADPVVYVVHASPLHAGLDVFTSRGNPRMEMSNILGRACATDLSDNTPRVLAELVDDLRFGEMAHANVPPGPATLQAFLTIAGDPQPPSPLRFDLVGQVAPQQPLRNGAPIGCVGGQADPTGELAPGGRYLMLLPTGLLRDNRSNLKGLSPRVRLQRLETAAVAPDRFELSVGMSLSRAGSRQWARAALKGGSTLVKTAPTDDGFSVSPVRVLPVAPVSLLLELEDKDGNVLQVHPLELAPKPGARLLVLAAGDSLAPLPVPAVATPREDDIDADGFVASPLDRKTKQPTQPNYSPADGSSVVVQDDCPSEPGEIFGCPAPVLTWIVIDLSRAEPRVSTYPMP